MSAAPAQEEAFSAAARGAFARPEPGAGACILLLLGLCALLFLPNAWLLPLGMVIQFNSSTLIETCTQYLSVPVRDASTVPAVTSEPLSTYRDCIIALNGATTSVR